MVEEREVAVLWGAKPFKFIFQPSAGLSGGLLCSWVESGWSVSSTFNGEGFLGVSISFQSNVVHVINVYAPTSTVAKRRLWNDLIMLKQSISVGEWCVVGDFNAVSSVEERKGRSGDSSYIEISDFNNFIATMDLIDVPVSGNRFSWFSTDGLSMSRLDRFLVSEGLIDLWGISGQWIGKRDISDHNPIWLIRLAKDWGPKPFRVFNAWFDHADFLPFVKDCWNGFNVRGHKAHVIKEKLKLLKEKLRGWNREVFGKIDLNIESLVRDLNSLDSALCEGWDSALVMNRKEVSISFWNQIQAKESFLAQKSRARWIKEGDMNSRYFHSLLKFKRRRCSLLLLRNSGVVIEEVEEVKNSVKHHFENCFVESCHFRPTLGGLNFGQLSRAEMDFLIEPFSEEEIREEVWRCDGDKSPGPDGFNMSFIKLCWDLLKKDVVDFINEFHDTAFLPKAICATFIALIPKNDNPQGLGEYRPISLIGSLYKILAKVLANRLKKVLPSVISSCQSAFLGGRQILDGVAVVNEVVDYAKRSKDECLLFKVDFEKAYDSISWKFLFYMLDRMGFPQKWILWMKSCVCNTTFSVLVNGSPTNDFKAHRGLRQGDPLSPFLFLIVAEGLSALVSKAVEIGYFVGYDINATLRFSIMQFADDTVLMGKPSWDNLWAIKTMLRSFELVSGLRVNFHKSKIIGINISEEFLDSASIFLHCKTESIPFKFLGIPVGANPRRATTWKPVLDMLRKRLASWKGRHLSIGGRVTLINSVLNSIPLYFFSFYKAPKLVIKAMVKIQRDFLWQINDGDRGMYWVAWDKVCKPKNEGGLGIKNLELFNVALLSKWKWRALIDDIAPWKGLLYHRYGSFKEAFIHRSEGALRRGAAGSIWWRDLLMLDLAFSPTSTFGQQVFRRVGNGASVDFWNDVWLGTSSFSRLFPSLWVGRDSSRLFVRDYGGWWDGVWRWNEAWLVSQSRINESEAEYLQQLLAPVTLTQEMEDSWVWKLETSKKFSVRSCYKQLLREVMGSNQNDLHKLLEKLWRCVAPSKVIVFGWRLLRDSLPTRGNLRHRLVIDSDDDALCPFCWNEVESQHHLFLSCTFASDIWARVCAWLRIAHVGFNSLFDHCLWWGKLIKGKKAKKSKYLVWLSTCWSIWLARNAIIFKNEDPNIDSIISRIKQLTWSWLVYRSNCNLNFAISAWWLDPLHCLNNM